MTEQNVNESKKRHHNGNFICGVVEGFYGRPWSPDHRKDLFIKMSKFGINSYLYAPKDDCKHRAYWKELYSVEEAEHLTSLIKAAEENDITFYYALSPGLDISYSNTKELTYLKRKLEQVSQFGCNAFALLFDDIEPDMCEADKEIFQSFAHAQVSVTNEVYQYLNQPKFLFCPTEYCATRAVPNVENSEYLNTIGSKLLPDIDIMWTGAKVITKTISVASLQELANVLHRPPVIWDNLHANDYDQKRLFLGPFSGRSPDLIPYLRGVLTNPNCEYEANFIAIHTLAQWSHCSVDGKRDLSNDSVSADIKLETNCESGSVEDIPCRINSSTYHPKQALRLAITDWLSEFSRSKCAYGKVVKPHIPVPPGILLPTVNTCISLTPSTSSTTTAHIPSLLEVTSTPSLSAFQPVPAIVMNSLLSSTEVADVSTYTTSEPMDCNSTPGSSPNAPEQSSTLPSKMLIEQNLEENKSQSDEDNGMITDISEKQEEWKSRLKIEELSLVDVALLVDLFYLPFEHGPQGLQLLQEFHWLKSNSHLAAPSQKLIETSTTEIEEWNNRAAKFNDLTEAVCRLYNRLVYIKNRSLLCDLYPYIWDIRGVICLLNSYVKWLALGHVPHNVASNVQGTYTWFLNGWKEAFMSGEQEPWVFRGGLMADLQRLLPLENISDLFIWKPPDPPCSKTFTIKPYFNEDKNAVYSVCLKTCFDGSDGSSIFSEFPDLIGDSLIGGFLEIGVDFTFVVENDYGICAYAVAALDAKEYFKKYETEWIPKLCAKYPLSLLKDRQEMQTVVEETIAGLHSYQANVPETVYKHYPSVIRIDSLSNTEDASLDKKLLACILSALKANGSFGVHCELSSSDKNRIEFYKLLGFLEVSALDEIKEGSVFLGRTYGVDVRNS